MLACVEEVDMDTAVVTTKRQVVIPARIRYSLGIKPEHKMSLADAFAAALAKTKKAELVTGDPEFKPLEGALKGIVWLKQ